MKIKNILIVVLIVSLSVTAQAWPKKSGDSKKEQPKPVASEPLIVPREPNNITPDIEQVHQPQEPGEFEKATANIFTQLEDSLADLTELREQGAMEKIPLSKKLNRLETELLKVRQEYQQTSRLLDSRSLDLNNLRSEIKSRQEEATYLSNLLSEYIRNFESRLHIAELQRYSQPLEEAKLAPENSNLTEEKIFETQANLLGTALERLHDVLGGTVFDGTAGDSSGSIHHGTFMLLGPSALFQSDDGQNIGTAEQRLGSLTPSVISFADPLDAQAATELFNHSKGLFPLDPTGGNAHKIAETNETLVEHIKKGGPVMYPIFVLAGSAILVAIFKWLSMLFIRKPSQKSINSLLTAVSEHDTDTINQKAKAIKGPIGKMIHVGVEHINEPRELIEEVMYEKMLAARLSLERFLPFIAISAASAPLLGLLGTVTGIINTFKLITVFGSGDVKTLSGGISEALITTEYGLIVAIPSLLIHAFLSRKAKSFINQMEKTAIAFSNQVAKSSYGKDNTNSKDNFSKLSPEQIKALFAGLGDRINSVFEPAATYSKDSAGALMNSRLISVGKNTTVAEAINKIRQAQLGDEIDALFIIDEDGKYVGHVNTRQLLTRSEQSQLGLMLDKNQFFVRVDTNKADLQNLFHSHDIANLPVLDHQDQLVGRVCRNIITNGDGNGDAK